MTESPDERLHAPGLSRRVALGAAASAIALAACGVPTRTPIERVLFVGNSLIYYNDMPSQFAQLASLALGCPVEAEMLARGGAHISHHAAAGVVKQELANGRYTALVLQEFGGGLRCGAELEKFGFSCEASHAAHADLAALAQRHGARSVLLGCYQRQRVIALDLSLKEAELAARIGAVHAGLGDFPELIDAHPEWPWLDPADGHHPGLDLSLLMALRTLKALYGQLPPVQAVQLHFRDYRGSYSPHMEALASAQLSQASLRQRRLGAAELARRIEAAGWNLPPRVG